MTLFTTLALCTALTFFPGTVHPDVVSGQDIVVESGQSMDEAVSLGGSVIVRGTVQDAVSLGGSVVVSGTVYDVVAIGKGIVVEPGGRIRGDAVALGGTVDVRDSASISGDVVTLGGKLLVAPTGSVGGERINIGGVAPETISEVGNNISRVLLFGPFAGVFGAIGVFVLLAFALARILLWLAVSALFYHFIPGRVETMAGALHFRFWTTLLYGFLVLVLLPFVFLLLLVTLVGIPLIPVAGVAFYLVYLFGSAGVALWAGWLLPGADHRSGMRNLLLGILTVSLLRIIPGVGILLWLIIASASFGAAVTTRLGGRSFGPPPGESV